MDFKPFRDIKRLGKAQMTITQKIHGSNAQIVITEDGNIRAGSRNRWIFPGDDNFGFATWVEQNKEVLIATLGPGVHFGEWAGPGINSGEGLTVKTLVLFDVGRYDPNLSIPQVSLVPVLYQGPIDVSVIPRVMDELKASGSKLVPGFMRPEGVVVSFCGHMYKEVFDAEETQWKKPSEKKDHTPRLTADYSHLCQPIRLEKLLSRDEVYLREYPKSLPDIVKAYVQDLIKEDQITGDEAEVKAITKGASGQIFKFIRTVMEERI